MALRVVLGLGSNSGNRLAYIKRAVKEICLSPYFDYIALSAVYETEPWGFKNQNKFLNCVLVVMCRLDPPGLIEYLKNLEKRQGRVDRGLWMKREIDIDVLFYGQKVSDTGGPGAVIPHPRMQYRNFVMVPLCELMPEFVHPGLGKSVRYLAEHSPDKSGVKLYRYQPFLS